MAYGKAQVLPRAHLTEAQMVDMYEHGASTAMIARAAGIGHCTVTRYLRDNGVRIRDRKEAARVSYDAGRVVAPPPHIPLTHEDLVARFWSKVQRSSEDECWPWTGCLAHGGYGYMRLCGQWRAHRIAWVLSYGPIPSGMCVCHHCDSPPCCNPRHLFLGTDADNNRDMMKKGRKVVLYGEKHPAAKLTNEQARSIFASRERSTVLASRYAVSVSTVQCIRQGKTWHHIHNTLAEALPAAQKESPDGN